MNVPPFNRGRGPTRAFDRKAGRAGSGIAVMAIVTLGLSPSHSLGQTGIVTGFVTDSAGSPLSGAEVRVTATGSSSRTDDRGHFHLAGLPTGAQLIHARRLGFRPESVRVAVGAAATAIAFRLSSLSRELPEVVVRRGRNRHTGRLGGFYERLESGTSGVFVTREQIDAGNTRTLTNVLQRVPGVEVMHGGRIRLRGRTCPPLVWIDDTPMPAGEASLDTFAPNSLEGVEIYMGATGAPARYQGTRGRNSCGTIVIWSRGRDTEERRLPTVAAAVELERIHAAGQLYLGDQVDRQADAADREQLPVVYPPELLAERVSGLVIVEAVIDSTGRLEPGTFGVLSSPHPLFTRAVQEALQGAVFHAAQHAGRNVRQLVQLRFRFEPPKPRHDRG